MHRGLADGAFGTGTATDYALALADAGEQIGQGAQVVAEQVGNDVIVFSGSGEHGNPVHGAVVQVGKTLADIAASDIIKTDRAFGRPRPPEGLFLFLLDGWTADDAEVLGVRAAVEVEHALVGEAAAQKFPHRRRPARHPPGEAPVVEGAQFLRREHDLQPFLAVDGHPGPPDDASAARPPARD
ncbi:MAG: hypothetical protein KGO51_05355 [Alphaproteobacteria bacterium]|nr:hypothetical protein [Alphaproteobacteria bacterium]